MRSNSPDSIADKKNPNLFARSVKGAYWVIGLRLCTHLLDFVKVMILARLLGVNKFGLLALAMLVVRTIKIFTETGFKAALVQKKEDTRAYLDTAWTIGLIRGIVLFAILYLFAPHTANFFDGPVEFSRSHILKPADLAVKLKAAKDPLSQHLNQKFSPATRELLNEFDSTVLPSDSLTQAMTDELNQVVKGPSLYKSGLFVDIQLSSYAEKLIARTDQDHDFSRLNRRLLQEVYQEDIEQSVIDVATTSLVIQLLGLPLIFGALGNIGTIYFKKDLQFNKHFLLQISTALTNVTVTVVLAFLYRSVWALVCGILAASVLGCLASYLLHPYRPKIHWDSRKALELWKFGKWILASAALGFLMTQGDDLFVAKFLGTTMLGFYLLAYKLSQAPATEITLVISQVTFPAFSKLQDDLPRLKAAYLKVLELTAFVVIPLAGLIFSLCHEFVNLILDDQWLPIIPVMQILAIMGLLHAVNATRGSVYRAVGRPAINTTIKLIRLALLIVLIYPLTSKWGLVGTAWAILLITIIIQPLAWYLVIKIVKCSVWEIFRPIMFPLTATAVMAGLISLSRYVLFAEITYISFISLAIIGIAAYLMTAWVCERFFGYTVRAILCEQLSVLSKKNQS